MKGKCDVFTKQSSERNCRTDRCVPVPIGVRRQYIVSNKRRTIFVCAECPSVPSDVVPCLTTLALTLPDYFLVFPSARLSFLLKADSHIACRAHAVPLPCRADKGLECVFPI
jgi:hypothetical protein